MSGKPVLTVAILGGDASRKLDLTLQSVLSQEAVEFEVLVVANRPLAEEERGAEHLADSRLRWIYGSSAEEGQAGLDLAVDASETPYIAFLRPGERLLPEALRKIVAVLDENPSTALVHCWWFDVDRLGRARKLAVREREEALRSQFAAHRGEEIDHAGDGFFVAFADAESAIACGSTLS